MHAVTITDLEAFESEAASFARSLTPASDHATLVTLSGDLGAGKTTFVQTVAKTLGITEPVTSPTFVLAKSYALSPDKAFSRLIHIDAYRLSGGKELAPLAFSEITKDPETLIMLEWPEMVADGLPVADTALRLAALQDGSRTITYD